MQYTIKNKIFSIGAASTVKDEFGNDLFYVKGKFFSVTRKKFIQKMDKTTLYTVRNKFFNLLLPKVFVMDADGKVLFTIKKKKFFSLRQDFEIVPEPGQDFNFSISGDIIGRHYDLLDGGVPVAHVRRNFNIVQDSFMLETEDDERAPLFIAFVIAIDNYFDKLESSSD